MKELNNCYTYFSIKGDFDPDKVTELLDLQPEKYWHVGDLRKDGSVYDFASWSYGRCDEYSVEVNTQMEKTISALNGKVDLLNKIRCENDVSFYLEVVPELYVGETVPSLNPSLAVIDFCHFTRTEIDIDMYLVSGE